MKYIDYRRNFSALLIGNYKKKSLIFKLHTQTSPWATKKSVHRVYFDNDIWIFETSHGLCWEQQWDDDKADIATSKTSPKDENPKIWGVLGTLQPSQHDI